MIQEIDTPNSPIYSKMKPFDLLVKEQDTGIRKRLVLDHDPKLSYENCSLEQFAANQNLSTYDLERNSQGEDSPV